MEVYRYKQEPSRPKYTAPERGKSRRIELANRTELLKRSKRNSGRRRGRNSTERSGGTQGRCKPENETSERRSLGADRFSRFSSLHSLQRAIANLIIVVKEFKRRRNKDRRKIVSVVSRAKNTHFIRQPTAKELQEAMTVIAQAVQGESFSEKLKAERRPPESNKPQTVPKSSKLYRLDPFVDNNGVLRVGGCLRRATLEFGERHPVLMPNKNHVADLIARHYHGQVHHQGRQITQGAIRQSGFWLIGGHNTVTRELSKCVTCKKLRRPAMEQRMADLPADGMEEAPPFTNVGFDVFGPWTIRSRKTRGGAANSKRWGLVFTCLSSRAIHIELLESMDASSFICALRRFFAFRGPASILRCDRGTNFVGAKSELGDALRQMDQRKVKGFVTNHGCEWIWNPPHASHFGIAWERQIGTIRRVLDAMFAELGSDQLTHELLVMLMAQVTAVVNARSISALSTDVDEPQPLSPSMLLTIKSIPI